MTIKVSHCPLCNPVIKNVFSISKCSNRLNCTFKWRAKICIGTKKEGLSLKLFACSMPFSVSSQSYLPQRNPSGSLEILFAMLSPYLTNTIVIRPVLIRFDIINFKEKKSPCHYISDRESKYYICLSFNCYQVLFGKLLLLSLFRNCKSQYTMPVSCLYVLFLDILTNIEASRH